ncbi:MAG: catalase family peroxidase [Geminicoccaceae bacterium]
MRFRYLTAAAATSLILLAGPAARADDVPVPEQIVDTMNQLFGRHPGIRANHAKGIVAEGSFTPGEAGKALSGTALFRSGELPVVVRFSDATGLPEIADGAPNANPHGMAIKFTLPDGSEMDIVANSLAFFPVATGEDFLALLQAAAASGPDAAKPTPLERFVADHPAVPMANASVQTPSSFARETYNGVNAFLFVAEDGTRHPFRFKIEPVDGAEHLSADEAKAKAPDFLVAELGPRLAKDRAIFRLSATLAAAGDPLDDATKPWPADRETVELGRITLTKVADDSAAAEKELLFLPTNLIDGIEASDDPLIQTRTDAYAVSFSRRSE